jgi:hypothetical protein
MARRELQLGPACDFVTVEALVQLGWKMPVRTMQLLVTAAYALMIPLATVVAVVLAALAAARRSSTDSRTSSSTALRRRSASCSTHGRCIRAGLPAITCA